jgi:hypothetical protein
MKNLKVPLAGTVRADLKKQSVTPFDHPLDKATSRPKSA